jgi:ribosomal protein S18 acetylase RimI-like enzyme
MEELTLRLVQIEDALALQLACWPERTLQAVRVWLEGTISRQQRELVWGLVAQVNAQIVAYGQVARWGCIAEISDLVVAEGYRCMGIGTQLIESLMDIAREHGLPEVEIGAAETNPRAAALYRRLGFQDKRRAILELGNGPEPVIYLSLRLETADPVQSGG